LLTDDHGQDLVEYALLVSFIGVTSVVAWAAIETAIGTAYVSWNGAVYSLWETPAPSGS
jgi:Flp pilus assembly pilin Flp